MRSASSSSRAPPLARPGARPASARSTAMSGIDILMLVAHHRVCCLLLVVLAAAETALNRISRVKAQALADSLGTQVGARLVPARHPSRTVHQPAARHGHVPADRPDVPDVAARRPAVRRDGAIAIGFVLNVVVFFVIAESMPKTWAVLKAERAALLTARPTELLVSFPPLRLISRGLIGLTNVLLPGKGLKEGPFVSEQELLGHRRGRRRGRRHRARGAPAHREHHRVRRHRRPRGDGAPARHDRRAPRRQRSPPPSTWPSPTASAACRCTARTATTWSG